MNNNKLEEVWQYSQTYMHTTYIYIKKITLPMDYHVSMAVIHSWDNLLEKSASLLFLKLQLTNKQKSKMSLELRWYENNGSLGFTHCQGYCAL